jgi:hypothetical protein
MSKIKIIPIEIDQFTEIISILDLQLGKGYLKQPKLLEYIEDELKSGFTAVTDGKISGVLLTKTYMSWSSLETVIFKEKNWFKINLVEKFPVGIIDIIGVIPQLMGYGIGTLLVKEGVETLDKNCNSIISFVWEHPEKTPLASILEKNNFIIQRTIPAYWNKNSVTKNYNCKYCGSSGCLCNALIYKK